MARYSEKHINTKGETVTVLDTDTELTVYNNQHGVEIGTAGTAEDARQMIDG